MVTEFSVVPAQVQTAKPNGFSSTPALHEAGSIFNATAGVRVRDQHSGVRPVPIEDLYPVTTAGRAQLLGTARALLAAGRDRLRRAHEYLDDGNDVGADYEVSLFQGDIPELFCCSSISEGLGAV